MRIVCNNCRALYSVDDSLIKGPHTKTKCPACGYVQPLPTLEGATESVAVSEPITRSGPPKPSTEKSASPVIRCNRCGSPLAMANPSGLCTACQELYQRRSLLTQDSWRVRKKDGTILGPFSTLEIREKFASGEIEPSEMLARGEEDFRLISSYPEFAYLFRRPGEKYRPINKGRKFRTLLMWLAVILIVTGAAGAIAFLNIQRSPKPDNSLLEEIRARFASEVGTPEESVDKLLDRAIKLMGRDENLSYLRADQILKSALARDPYHLEAAALWVKNRALIDILMGDASERKTAFDLLDIMLGQKKDHPLLLQARALLLLAAGQSADARVLVERLITIDNNPENHLILAMSLMNSATELALDKLDNLRRKMPKHPLVSRLTATAYLRLGRFHEAKKLLENRLRMDPGRLDVMVDLANLMLQVGEFEAANENFENILAADKSNLEALLMSSRIISQIKHQPQAALVRLKKFSEGNTELSPREQSLLLAETSVVLRLLGRISESLTTATKALELDSENGVAIFHQALAEYLYKQMPPAERFSEALVHFPSNNRLMAWRVQSLALNEPTIAGRELASLVQANDQDIENILLAACLAAFMEDLSRSYALIKQAMAANPFYHEWYTGTSPLYDRDVFWKAPEKWARNAAERFPDDPLLASLYAWVLLYQEKFQPAQDWFTKALVADPDCFPANLGAGLVAWRQNQKDRALSFWSTAHRLEPSQPVAAALLSLALSATGKFEPAEQLLAESLEVNPGHRLISVVRVQNWLAAKKTRKAEEQLLKLYRVDENNLFLKSLIYQLEK